MLKLLESFDGFSAVLGLKFPDFRDRRIIGWQVGEQIIPYSKSVDCRENDIHRFQRMLESPFFQIKHFILAQARTLVVRI